MTVLLVINTWTDIRKKEICLPVLFIFLAGGILWRIRQGLLWPAGIISMGIGVFIILTALISGGMVGFGDGLLILTMGSVLGAGELAGILCGALLLCGIYSGIEYLMLKKSRSCEKNKKGELYNRSCIAHASGAYDTDRSAVSGFFCT